MSYRYAVLPGCGGVRLNGKFYCLACEKKAGFPHGDSGDEIDEMIKEEE